MKQRSITWYASLFLLGVLIVAAILLGSIAYQRNREFIEHENYLAERSVTNVAGQIRLYMDKQRRVAGLTADMYGRDLQYLAAFSSTDPRETELWGRIRNALPMARNFTLADGSGTVLFEDLKKTVGVACRRDIVFYANNGHPDEIFIHGNPPGNIGNHIDLVTDIREPGMARFLFISLGLEELTDILAKGQAFGHLLYLVRKDKPRVELTAAGLPTKEVREDADRIIQSNQAAIDIPGTRWRLVDVIEPTLLVNQRHRQVINAAVSFLIFTLVCLPLIWLIHREENKRRAAQEALRKANSELEERVAARTAALLESRSELDYLVSHDPLTGLMNRKRFEEALNECLDKAGKEGLESALCYIDVDQFKIINDTAGHVAGDFLLSLLGPIIQDQVDESDLVARLGGDEFGVIMNDCSPECAMEKTERIRTAIRDMHFEWGGSRYDVTASIGLVPVDRQSEDTQTLMAAADAACFTAKDQGRNQIHFHDPARFHSEHSTLIKRSQEITRAMQENRLELYCQPIEHIAARKIMLKHYEVLLRMRGADGELIMPDHFIPAAERFGHMSGIDLWVTGQALRWLGRAPDNYHLNVNLSGQTISNPDSLEHFDDLLQRHGKAASRLCFEITETAAVSNYTHARQFISRLRDLGCSFALDDYGSGVCSISYLRNLPIDLLKIDGELVTSASSDSVALAMVESIVTMARAMDVKTVAEYIEDRLLLKKMQQLGVDYGQGYYLGRPAPVAEMLEPAGMIARLRPA